MRSGNGKKMSKIHSKRNIDLIEKKKNAKFPIKMYQK